MALDLYTKEDIQRVLRSLFTAMENANAAIASPNRPYSAGYRNALEAVALAFGIGTVEPPPPDPSLEQIITDAYGRYEQYVGGGS